MNERPCRPAWVVDEVNRSAWCAEHQRWSRECEKVCEHGKAEGTCHICYRPILPGGPGFLTPGLVITCAPCRVCSAMEKASREDIAIRLYNLRKSAGRVDWEQAEGYVRHYYMRWADTLLLLFREVSGGKAERGA